MQESSVSSNVTGKMWGEEHIVVVLDAPPEPPAFCGGQLKRVDECHPSRGRHRYTCPSVPYKASGLRVRIACLPVRSPASIGDTVISTGSGQVHHPLLQNCSGGVATTPSTSAIGILPSPASGAGCLANGCSWEVVLSQ